MKCLILWNYNFRVHKIIDVKSITHPKRICNLSKINYNIRLSQKFINVLFVPVCKKSAVINWFFSQVCLDANGKLEEEFTVARFKSEVKNLVQRCQGLETFQADSNKKVSEYEKELCECRLLISQHEARMQTLSESMKEAEARKRESAKARKRGLEEEVDALHEVCAMLKAAEQV